MEINKQIWEDRIITNRGIVNRRIVNRGITNKRITNKTIVNRKIVNKTIVNKGIVNKRITDQRDYKINYNNIKEYFRYIIELNKDNYLFRKGVSFDYLINNYNTIRDVKMLSASLEQIRTLNTNKKAHNNINKVNNILK